MRTFLAALTVLAAASFLALVGWSSRPAAAIVPSGSIILVDTTADTEAADGYCSLREAINAANINGYDDTCGPGTGADAIRFSLGSGNPVINVTASPVAATHFLMELCPVSER